MRLIAVDSMVFIYFFEKREPYAIAAKKIIADIEEGQIDAVTSLITVIEVLSAAKLSENSALFDDIHLFFQTTPHLKVVPLDWQIAEMTAKLRQQYPKLRTPDAIQLATAVIGDVDFLLTNDHKLLHLVRPPVHIKTLTEIAGKLSSSN